MTGLIKDSKAEEYLRLLSGLLEAGDDFIGKILSEVDSIRSLKLPDSIGADIKFSDKERIGGSTPDDPREALEKAVSSAALIDLLFDSLTELAGFNDELDTLISCSIAYYWFYKDSNGISRVPRNRLMSEGLKRYELLKSKNIKLPYIFNSGDFEAGRDIGFDCCIPPAEIPEVEGIRYLQCLAGIKQERLRDFLGADELIAGYHILEAARAATVLKDCLAAEFARSSGLLSQIFSNNEDGLITETIRLYIEIKQSKKDASAVLDLIDYLIERFKEAISLFEEKYNCSLGLSLNKLNKLRDGLRPKDPDQIAAASSGDSLPAGLEGCFDRILEFSGIDADRAEFFKSAVKAYKRMENKEKLELVPAETKILTNRIFLEIYEAVLKRVLTENISDKAFDLFLTFGFMDDELLTRQQILALYKLLDIYESQTGIYTAKTWLTEIYKKSRTPSINEMGLDYEQALKEGDAKRPAGNKPDENSDSGASRLNYEIMNMFQVCSKLCYGQVSTYFPVLHNDMLPDDITKAVVTVNRVRDSLQNILLEDYSAFHREVFYTGSNPALKKELIMKQVLPDILLLPTAGTKGIMWQETSGRSKLTPGRFVLPILTLEDLNSLFIRLVGSFRWELCRAVMGARWNDISYNSLTADYSDYILEYKKNKNLSQESKDRIKNQIQRYHGNLRNIFCSDYEAWIKSEARGVRKVNKETRAILYKYCPLNRSVREELAKQPAYADIAAQFEAERKRIARELENRYAAYGKQGHVMEQELLDNLAFYKEF